MKREVGHVFVFLLLALSLSPVAGDCPQPYGWVRSTGDWPSDAFGTAQWNAAEPNGLMALDSNCNYVSQPISKLHVGTSYQWKVTTQNTWDVNFGCPGQNGPNCAFTTATGTVQFVFNPRTLALSTVDISSSSSSATSTSSSSTHSSSTTSSSTTSTSSQPSSTTGGSNTPPPYHPGSGKQVFAHFMMGNSYGYDQGHFQTDMALAKSAGIDAFALNIGSDSWVADRLQLAYAAAQAVGFQLFISFDLSIINDANYIINTVVTVNGYPASYKYNGKLFVSTFGGAGLNLGYGSSDAAAWAAIKSTLAGRGIQIFLVPNFEVDASNIFNQYPSIDGALSWAAWPDPKSFASALTPGDDVYMNSANNAGKVYLAPISPWFYTHLSYKNYIYHTDSLWYDRWQQLLQIKPHMIEILTWNDWGESHYIGPIDSNSGDLPEGSSNYVYGFPHTAWLDTLPYFIQYYKTGSAPTVSQDLVVYWYRPYLKSSQSSDPLGQPYVANQNTSPSNYSPQDVVADSIFVLTILKSAGTITVNGGSPQNVPAGANLYSTGLNTGQQTVTLSRNGAQVCSSTGAISVGTNPSTYNYNAYVGECKSN
eukprot:Phypoly_transcript_05168.p1 GENE.Phypoly_transcript_05168~~Phypoly_transcript_05168.p1  ORF type:complete len:593 (+),score=109.83 Phypoly_transcript_05168:98-1876(+)